MIRALGLTADQEDKIEAALPAGGGKGGAGAAQSTDKVWAVVLAVLSPDQKGKWEQLTGKMLPTAELQKANEIDLNRLNPNDLLPPGLIPGEVLPPGCGALPPVPEKKEE